MSATSPQQFMALSSALTGFELAELQSTGMSEIYYDVAARILGGGLMGDLLGAWQRVASHAGDDPDTLEALLDEWIMEDARLAPMARNIATMWYLGQWNQMPGDWRGQYGADANDLTHIISPAAYRAGLVWSTIGAHPMGARQQGFGAWALPPTGDST